MASLGRRQLLRTAVGLGQTGLAPAAPHIRAREEWAVDRPPKGPLDGEDVRFLVVHHSASHNGHAAAEVPQILRSFYDFHTSARGWNDIAYNFLIDSEGGIWEGRAGSLDGPVAGDATGGNQGFSQLICIIGDYSTAQPSSESLTALASLSAWLADRFDVSTAAGSEVSFVSRGSNRHPAGSEVITPTITGHRTMSLTTCPGDKLNAYVVNGLMGDVDALRVPEVPSTTTSPPSTTTTLPSTTSSVAVDSTTAPSIAPAPATTVPVGTFASGGFVGIIAGTGAVVVLGIGAAAWRHRRMRRD